MGWKFAGADPESQVTRYPVQLVQPYGQLTVDPVDFGLEEELRVAGQHLVVHHEGPGSNSGAHQFHARYQKGF